MKITVRYKAVDGYSETRSFKTMDGARKYAQRWVGDHPELNSGYAVSDDGVGTILVDGCTVAQLFGQKSEATGDYELWQYHPRYGSRDEITGSIGYLMGKFQSEAEAWSYLDSKGEPDPDDSFRVKYTGVAVELPIIETTENCPF